MNKDCWLLTAHCQPPLKAFKETLEPIQSPTSENPHVSQQALAVVAAFACYAKSFESAWQHPADRSNHRKKRFFTDFPSANLHPHLDKPLWIKMCDTNQTPLVKGKRQKNTVVPIEAHVWPVASYLTWPGSFQLYCFHSRSFSRAKQDIFDPLWSAPLLALLPGVYTGDQWTDVPRGRKTNTGNG